MSPKATQVDTPRPHETYGIYCVDHTLGGLGRARGASFFYTAFWTPLFATLFPIFVNRGAQKGPKKGGGFASKTSKIRFRRQIAPRRAPKPQKGAQKSQNDPQSDPTLTHLPPKGHQSFAGYRYATTLIR